MNPGKFIVRELYVVKKTLILTYHTITGTPLPTFTFFGTYKIIDRQSSDIAESCTLSCGHTRGRADGLEAPFLWRIIGQ
jgi:hypothetical protein